MNAARKRLPDERDALTHKLDVGDKRVYVTTGVYPDTGKLGEVFIRVHGTTHATRALLDAVGIAVSIGLQYGIPIDVFCSKYEGTQFEPADPPRYAASFADRPASSLLDAVFRWLRVKYGEPPLPEEPAVVLVGFDAPVSEPKA